MVVFLFGLRTFLGLESSRRNFEAGEREPKSQEFAVLKDHSFLNALIASEFLDLGLIPCMSQACRRKNEYFLCLLLLNIYGLADGNWKRPMFNWLNINKHI